MAIKTLLQRRKSGTYYIRKKVPVSLRMIVGKSEIVKSLGTNKYNDALSLLAAYECGIMEHLNQLSVGNKSAPTFPELNHNRATIMNPIALASINYANNDTACYKASEAFVHLKKRNQLRKSTCDEYTKVINQFIEVYGDLPLDQFNKKHVKDFIGFIKAIGKIPKSKEHKNKTLPELHKLAINNKIEGREPLAYDTLNKKLSAISSLFNIAVQDDFIEHNPAHGITITKDDIAKKQDRLGFSIDNLNCLFSSPMYTGCKSSKRRKDPGTLIIKDEKFWIPLIALFTGARINEIAQLLLSDIKQDNGLLYFDITNADDSQSLKTDSSRRRVPVHNEIINIGLMEYISGLKQSNQTKLFPALKIKASKDTQSAKISSWLNNYFENIGIKDDVSENEIKSFHSFRHTFKTACRAAKVEEEIHDRLTGHSNSSTGRGYGECPISILHEEINKVAYAGLELRHLYIVDLSEQQQPEEPATVINAPIENIVPAKDKPSLFIDIDMPLVDLKSRISLRDAYIEIADAKYGKDSDARQSLLLFIGRHYDDIEGLIDTRPAFASDIQFYNIQYRYTTDPVLATQLKYNEWTWDNPPPPIEYAGKRYLEYFDYITGMLVEFLSTSDVKLYGCTREGTYKSIDKSVWKNITGKVQINIVDSEITYKDGNDSSIITEVVFDNKEFIQFIKKFITYKIRSSKNKRGGRHNLYDWDTIIPQFKLYFSQDQQKNKSACAERTIEYMKRSNQKGLPRVGFPSVSAIIKEYNKSLKNN